MYYLKDAQADLFKMMELVETKAARIEVDFIMSADFLYQQHT